MVRARNVAALCSHRSITVVLCTHIAITAYDKISQSVERKMKIKSCRTMGINCVYYGGLCVCVLVEPTTYSSSTSSAGRCCPYNMHLLTTLNIHPTHTNTYDDSMQLVCSIKSMIFLYLFIFFHWNHHACTVCCRNMTHWHCKIACIRCFCKENNKLKK